MADYQEEGGSGSFKLTARELACRFAEEGDTLLLVDLCLTVFTQRWLDSADNVLLYPGVDPPLRRPVLHLVVLVRAGRRECWTSFGFVT